MTCQRIEYQITRRKAGHDPRSALVWVVVDRKRLTRAGIGLGESTGEGEVKTRGGRGRHAKLEPAPVGFSANDYRHLNLETVQACARKLDFPGVLVVHSQRKREIPFTNLARNQAVQPYGYPYGAIGGEPHLEFDYQGRPFLYHPAGDLNGLDNVSGRRLSVRLSALSASQKILVLWTIENDQVGPGNPLSQ